MIQIKMFAAKNGDSFLLKMSGSTESAILIDAGYTSTFEKLILPELQLLRTSGQALDLVIATHIDSDHILGLLEFFSLNGNSQTPNLIEVKSVWHNSLRSIPFQRSLNELSSQDKQVLKAICSLGFPKPSAKTQEVNEISGKQGSSLAALLLSGQYNWNHGDGSKAISSESPQIRLNENISIKVLGPPLERLQSLRVKWMSELARRGCLGEVTQDQYFDDAFEFLSASEKANLQVREIGSRCLDELELQEAYEADKALNNGSSITVIIENSINKLLFLGDAWAEDVIESLRQHNSSTKPMYFDAIKISHHGSVCNTSPELLTLIDSSHFLISSDGSKHNHPDFPVLKEIVDRPSNFVRHLHFNYSTDASRKLKTYKSKSGAKFVVHENCIDWIKVGSE